MSLQGVRALQNRNRPLDKTDRETKQAIIRTSNGSEIRGTVYLVPGTRTIDLLDRETESFVAVTAASVTFNGRTEHAPFVAVNKSQIVTVQEVPRGEDDQTG